MRLKVTNERLDEIIGTNGYGKSLLTKAEQQSIVVELLHFRRLEEDAQQFRNERLAERNKR